MFGAVLYLFRQMVLAIFPPLCCIPGSFQGPINEAANIISDLQSSIAAAGADFPAAG